MNENPEDLRKFTLTKNSFLHKETTCYFVLNYLRKGVPGNPNFILTLKNTFGSESGFNLNSAKGRVRDILCRWAPLAASDAGLSSYTMVCVPRAKALSTYLPTQLYLLDAVSEAAQLLPQAADGSGAIVRTSNTKTTHLRNTAVTRVTAQGTKEPNTGAEPYPGITAATCMIDTASVNGKDILLVDDIYTSGVNIDEDCIQALYDVGARKVVLFALSCTV